MFDILYYIENIDRRDNNILISGWCCSKTSSDWMNINVLNVSTDRIKVTHRKRPDVAQKYSDFKGGMNSGFFLEISDSGKIFNYLILEFKDNVSDILIQHRINVSRPKPAILRKLQRLPYFLTPKRIVKVLDNKNITRIDPVKHPDFNISSNKQLYIDSLFQRTSDKSPDYVNICKSSVPLTSPDMRLVAFYLPQYHPMPENDNWWGKGFTEWTNVSKSIPIFNGHYQPHLPDELGFYDLRVPEVMQRQIELAKMYGIYGFCFYYYWFGGKRLLERPLNQFLQNPDYHLPFCICWANENWTRRWDGLESEILIGQNHSPDEDLQFIKDIIPILADPRYIRIDNRPLLIIYRPELFPDMAATLKRWNNVCIQAGIGELYVLGALTFGYTDPRVFGLEAGIEFPPHNMVLTDVTDQIPVFNKNFRGKVYYFPEWLDQKNHLKDYPFKTFKCVFPNWDNTARKPNEANILIGTSPEVYKRWLLDVCNYTRMHFPSDERFVFINAWNEWAEGAHLEPDRKYGYAYLQTTADVIRELQDTTNSSKPRTGH
jgi:hypothetical protein